MSTTARNPSVFCPLSLHQNFTVRPFILLSCPRALAPFHLLALSTCMCQIYSPLTPLAPFSIHEGLSTRAHTTRKAGCIGRERERKKERDKDERQGRGCADRGPVRKREGERERQRKRRRKSESSPRKSGPVKEGKGGCRNRKGTKE